VKQSVPGSGEDRDAVEVEAAAGTASTIEAAVELEPAVAAEIAGDRIDVLRAFAANLIEHGETLGLIGPLELPRIWTRHLLNSAVLAPLIGSGYQVADIGTGGGMPGLVLAIVRPDAHFILIEPMERRCAWLNDQIDELGLQNVEVRRGRAEEFHGAFEVDQITARAVTALRKLIPLTAPLLRSGGELLLLKGSSVQGEIDAAVKVISKFKVHDLDVQELGSGQLTETTRVLKARVR